jgi:hypothetical protein
LRGERHRDLQRAAFAMRQRGGGDAGTRSDADDRQRRFRRDIPVAVALRRLEPAAEITVVRLRGQPAIFERGKGAERRWCAGTISPRQCCAMRCGGQCVIRRAERIVPVDGRSSPEGG